MAEHAQKMEAELQNEIQRRCFEELRALVEGAKFVIHSRHGAQLQHVWLDVGARALMRRAEADTPGPAEDPEPATGAPRGEPAEATRDGRKAPARSLAVKRISQTIEGGLHFPASARKHPGLWKHMKRILGQQLNSGARRPKDGPDPSRSFSVLVDRHEGLHLEVPPGGNGRSRDEWVRAFEDLRNGKLDLERFSRRRAVS